MGLKKIYTIYSSKEVNNFPLPCDPIHFYKVAGHVFSEHIYLESTTK